MDMSCKGLVLALVLIFLISLLALQPATVKAVPKTITVPDEYSTILAAIDHSNAGDTIQVKSGTYNEQAWEISKSLTITSEFPLQAKLNFNPPLYPTYYFGLTTMVYNNSIDIKANNVKLSGFIISNEVTSFSGNATLGKQNRGFISANGYQIQIANNIIGIKEMPFNLNLIGNGNQAINNTLANLSITGSNQTAAYNNVGGISVSGSFNTIAKNSAGSLMLMSSTNNSITGNSFTADRGGGMIQLIDADYNVISNNTIICDGGVGIALGYGNPKGGSYNVFAGNTVERAKLWGILVGKGSNNVFYGNLITNCGGLGHDGFGLALGGTHIEVDNNLFFYNAFVNNSYNFGGNWQVIGLNFFDNGTVGNYWDDYLTKYPSATQVDSSGIGNMPYLVYGNVTDNYPLMAPFDISSINIQLPSWVNTTVPNMLPAPSIPPLHFPSQTSTTIQAKVNNGSTFDFAISGNITSSQLSNITITTNQSATTLSFTVTGESDTVGFGNITIPISAVPYGTIPTLYVDGQPTQDQGYTKDNSNYYVWYTTHFSTHEISIVFTTNSIPELSSWTIPLSLIIMAVAAGLLVYFKKRKREVKS